MSQVAQHDSHLHRRSENTAVQYTPTNLADVVFGHKDVPGCQVSVHKALGGEVVHSQGNLLGEVEQ